MNSSNTFSIISFVGIFAACCASIAQGQTPAWHPTRPVEIIAPSAVVGTKKLDAPEVAYWEEALRRMSKSAEWQKALEAEYWTNSFTVGRDWTRFLESEYAEDKTVLSELGLAK